MFTAAKRNVACIHTRIHTFAFYLNQATWSVVQKTDKHTERQIDRQRDRENE